MGISDLGGCRRRAGYILAGYPPEKPSGSVQAVIGTAVHDKADAELIAMREQGIIPADSVINEEVWFAGIKGHPDLYVQGMLRDIKTLGYDAQLDAARLRGPKRQHLWQVMTYAAACILADRPVHTVQIDYLVRDSGRSWLWEGPFDMAVVREAMQWLESVRDTPLDMLARDYAPDSPVCGTCPFFGVCWDGHVLDRDERSVLLVEDADAVKWVHKLEDARQAVKWARNEEALAKGALDALRPNSRGRGEVQIEGYEKILRWTVTSRRTLDTDAVRQDYARNGAAPPLTAGQSVKLELVAPPRDED